LRDQIRGNEASNSTFSLDRLNDGPPSPFISACHHNLPTLSRKYPGEPTRFLMVPLLPELFFPCNFFISPPDRLGIQGC